MKMFLHGTKVGMLQIGDKLIDVILSEKYDEVEMSIIIATLNKYRDKQ